jgi:hypothetical protein
MADGQATQQLHLIISVIRLNTERTWYGPFSSRNKNKPTRLMRDERITFNAFQKKIEQKNSNKSQTVRFT